MSCLSSLKVAAGVLCDAFAKHTEAAGSGVGSLRPVLPLRDTGVARNASISATTAMHGIGAVVRNLRSVLHFGRGEGDGRVSVCVYLTHTHTHTHTHTLSLSLSRALSLALSNTIL